MSVENTEDKIYIEWCTDDITQACVDCHGNANYLTLQQKRNVLSRMSTECNMTWDIIYILIDIEFDS